MNKRKVFFKVLIFALILTTAWILVAPYLAANLVVEKPLEKADAIMVLSGSREFIERTHAAAELYNRGISKKIILTDDGGRSGWNQAEQTNLKFSELARRQLIQQGVASEDIEILEPEVGGTIYEARLFVEDFAKDKDMQNLLLVTSAYHTRRTLWTFERELRRNNSTINVGIEHAAPSRENPAFQTWWLSVNGWRVIGGEYLKLLVYRLYY